MFDEGEQVRFAAAAGQVEDDPKRVVERFRQSASFVHQPPLEVKCNRRRECVSELHVFEGH